MAANTKLIWSLLLMLFLVNFLPASVLVQQTSIFVSGEDGYDTYRIPALAVTNSGALLAFVRGAGTVEAIQAILIYC